MLVAVRKSSNLGVRSSLAAHSCTAAIISSLVILFSKGLIPAPSLRVNEKNQKEQGLLVSAITRVLGGEGSPFVFLRVLCGKGSRVFLICANQRNLRQKFF